jgi:ABC-type Fe3+-hydroxamate transport system substrate-binding protein
VTRRPTSATPKRLVAWLLLGIGCASPNARRVDGPPRLVSLVPAFTETIAEIGARETLAGRSDWCVLPTDIAHLPSFGTALTPALEPLARTAATAVLLDGSGATRAADIAAIAPVVSLPWLTLSDVVAGTRRLGALTGRVEAAEALAQRFATLGDVPVGPALDALLVLGDAADGREVWYIMPGSLHGAALRSAGGVSVLPDPSSGPPVISTEALMRLDPPRLLVLVPTSPGADIDAARHGAQAAWGHWSSLTAVQTGRLAIVAGPAVMSTGPSILATRDALRDALLAMP